MDGPDFSPHDGKKDLVIPRFHMEAIKNNVQSEAQGRPIFHNMEMIEIIIPGNRESIVNRFVRQEDRERWPAIYAAFKAGQEAPLDGTPIKEWAAIDRAQAEELAYFNVRTVEALAELSDAAMMKVSPMGGHALREKAKAWLEQAKGNAPLMEMQARAERAEADKAALERQLADLAGRLQKLEDKKREDA